MASPLHVLAVGLADEDAARLASSLRASGFTPDVQRAIDVAEALAALDHGFDVIVLSPEVPGAAREALVAEARARRRSTYVLGLGDLLDPAEVADRTAAAPGGARLSTVLARKALTGKAGLGRDGGWVFDLLNTGRSEVYVVDAQTLRLRFANQQAQRNTGHRRDALLAMTLPQLAPALDEAAYRRLLEPLVTRQHDVVTLTLEHERADGTRYPLELHLRWFERDRAAVLVGIGQDQSRAREAERALARSRLALEGVRDAVLVLSPAGTIESANEAAARVYRRPVEELVGLRPQDLAAPEQAARASLEPRAAPRARDVVRAVHRRSDGTLFEAEVVQHAGDAAGERLAVMVVRDVTEHRKVATALEEAGESLRTILHAAPDPVVLLDPSGQVTSWSRSAERLFGWSEAEVLGRPAPFVPPDREAEWQTLLRIVQEGNSLGPIQVVRRRRDGARVDVLLSMSPLRGRDRRARGAVVVMSDVTDRTRAEVERAHLIAALDLAPDEVYLVEPGTLQVQFANERAARACGATPEAVTGLSLLELEPGLTAEAFAARAGAALLPGAAPVRYSTSLRAPGGGLRQRQVELATIEHAGVRVHVLVAFDPPSDPGEATALLHAALRVAGLGVVEVDGGGGVLELDDGARRLLGLELAAPAPPSLGDLARAARAPELLDAGLRLEQEREVHGCVHVAAAGAVHAIEVSALAGPDGRRVLVLAPTSDETGLVGAVLEGLRRAAAGGPFGQVVRPACEWLARTLPARATWLGREGGELAVAGVDAFEARPLVTAALQAEPRDLDEALAGARAGRPVVVPLVDTTGARLGWAGAFVDAAQHERAARALGEAGAGLSTLLLVAGALDGLRLRAVALDATGAAVAVADPDGHVRWATSAASHDLALSHAARDAVARGEAVEERAELEGHAVLRRVVPVRGPTGDVAHLVAVERDVTALEEAAAAARRATTHDPVTGLPTLVALEGARPAAALALDLDRFWELNATIGPAAADRVLRAVAARLQASLGTGGRLLRGRGDVVVALFDDAARVDERARALLGLVGAHPFATPDAALREVRLTASGGLAVGDDTPERLVLAAEAALKQARPLGAGALVSVTAPAGGEALQRLAHEQALRAALAAAQLEAAWVPERDLATGDLVARVASPVWRTEALGELAGPPLVLLAGAADPLAWAATLARVAARLRCAGGGPAPLVLPTSIAPGLGAALAETILAELGARPAADVTVELHGAHPPGAADVAALRARGLTVAAALAGPLDAEGLAGLGLGALVLPASTLRRLPDDAGARAFAAAAAAAAQVAGCALIAEGVATERQRDAALAAGYGRGRGPLLGVAVPV